MKVAVIFDNQIRSETTGFYCRRALSRLVDVEQLLPEELNRIPAGLFDLFVLIDDGLDYQLPDELRPRAAWAIDTHMSLERCISRFGNADWVFAAQKLGAQQMQRALGRDVHWLPLGCDPQLHHPVPGALPEYDIGFVGHEIGNRRMEMLKILSEHFPNHWFGQAFHWAMAERTGQFKVAFNCSVSGDLNMRVFEALACGTALVTDASETSGLSEIFELGEHLICYS